MFASFLNLRKRLLIRHLSVVALVAGTAAEANAALSLTEQMFQRIQEAGNFNENTSNFNTSDLVDVFNKNSAVKRAAYEDRHRSQINNISFVNALWTLPSTELMSLNFAGRSALAPDATFRNFGFAKQSDLDRFRKMLSALRDDMIKQGKTKVLSLEDIEKLAQLLAQGKTTDGELSIEGIDKSLLAAVQEQAKSFEAADSPEARQAAMAAFTEALGSLAETSAASEAGALLSSAHGALESHNIQDSFNLLQQDTSSGSDQMLAALGGKLFSDLDLKNTEVFVDEDKMASNSGGASSSGTSLNNAWVPKGMTEELLRQQRTAAVGNFRGFNSGAAPATTASPEEEQARSITSGFFDRATPSNDGNINDSGKVLANGKPGNHQSPTSDAHFKDRLGEITKEEGARQPASFVPPTQTPTDPALPKAEPVASVDPLLKEAALISVADAGVADLAAKEAEGLGLTGDDAKKFKDKKVQAAVDKFIKDNSTPTPTHNSVARLSSGPSTSADASNGETPVASNSCSLLNEPQELRAIFSDFAKAQREIFRPQDLISLKKKTICTGSSACVPTEVDSGAIAQAEAAAERAEKNYSPEDKLMEAWDTKDTGKNFNTLINSIISNALPDLAKEGWCNRKDDGGKDLQTLSNAYSKALFTLMSKGPQPVLATDKANGCPKFNRYGSDEEVESFRSWVSFLKFEVRTNVGLQNLAPSLKADTGGVTYCSRLDLDPTTDAGLNQTKLGPTFIGSLLEKCRASFGPLADHAFEHFNKNQSFFLEKKILSPEWRDETHVARRRCMEHRLSLATLKAFGIHHNNGSTRSESSLVVETPTKHNSSMKAQGI